MYLKQVTIVTDEFDTFINKHTDAELSTSRQKQIQKLFKKDIFKLVILNKIPGSTQVFNFYFVDNIKDPCINKVDEKSCLIAYAYNDEKNDFIKMQLSKIPGVSKDISSCLAAIN